MEGIYALAGVAVGGSIIGILWFLLRDKVAHAAVGEKNVLQERLHAREHDIIQLQERLHEEVRKREQAIVDLTQSLTAVAAAEEKSLRVTGLEQENKALAEDLTDCRAQVSELASRLDAERNQAAEKIELLKQAREQLKLEFENLANRIFEDKSQRFTDQNRQNLNALLTPLGQQISEFSQKVDNAYNQETRERASLLTEVKQLRELNQNLAEDAINLTNALKGQNKMQGNWGEVILERILEQSGLQNGREYETQGSFRDADGKLLRPDVLVHLPDEKDVVVDSKVSLKAYEAYCSALDEADRAAALQQHLLSIRNHAKQLGAKAYDEIPGLCSLNFVFMFMPVEGAFSLMLQEDYGVFQEAFEHNVMIVSPSTLMINLRTIHNIWRHEYQNRNAGEIAVQAGALYDQFVRFMGDLAGLQSQLDRAQESCDAAIRHLSTGRGNLVQRAETLREMGAKTKRSLAETVQAVQVD